MYNNTENWIVVKSMGGGVEKQVGNHGRNKEHCPPQVK